jgi:hypothetical protein
MEEKKLPEAKMLDMLNSGVTSTVVVQSEDASYLIHKIDDPIAGIRAERNRLLGLCDWTQAVDAPLSDAQKQAWQTYRQELRDLTKTYTSPDQVVWPKLPGA